MINQPITGLILVPLMSSTFQVTRYLGSVGYRNTTDRGLTLFRKHRISPYSFISPVSSEGGTNWVSTVTISLWACSPKNFAMFRICGRLPTAENNRFPTAESSFLYSFVFVFGPSHSRSQAERYLWNRVACSDTKKICVCLWFILFYVSTQCFHACWHVYLIHISHAHSAWLKTSSNSAA